MLILSDLNIEYRTICQPVWDAAVFELYLGSVGYVDTWDDQRSDRLWEVENKSSPHH